ncbi:pro-sigmaK processing inhibitor BofA family protein [Bacillus niameyensis]|uniref:pro-sigmaK processing inhibitor BofA family protein n=1 Tax=Bacillus niameyensis TaxID=1522308 RepID=UPI000781E512|nr:pro-sigmaK processing inhibitor BofA family protein [Bacillus niameyensis]
MESYVIIAVLAGVVILLLMAGVSKKAFRFIGQAFMKLMIGALFLFFLNAIGNQFGIYVPINFVTSTISGFLGIPGVAALAALQYWIF